MVVKESNDQEEEQDWKKRRGKDRKKEERRKRIIIIITQKTRIQTKKRGSQCPIDGMGKIRYKRRRKKRFDDIDAKFKMMTMTIMIRC